MGRLSDAKRDLKFLKSIFENFEIKLKDTWCPFGIRER